MSCALPEFKVSDALWTWCNEELIGWRCIKVFEFGLRLSHVKIYRIEISEEDATMMDLLPTFTDFDLSDRYYIHHRGNGILSIEGIKFDIVLFGGGKYDEYG